MPAPYFKIGQLIRNRPKLLCLRTYLIIGINNSTLGGRIIPGYFHYSVLDGDKIISLDMENETACKFYVAMNHD